MRVAVVGRGNVGGGLGEKWEQAGHEVARIGRDGGDVSDADAVLMAVPGGAVADAFETVSGWDGKTVIDATNLIGAEPPEGFASNAEYIKSRTGGPTAKAFNANFMSLLGRLGGQTNEIYFHPGTRHARPFAGGPQGMDVELDALLSPKVREAIDKNGLRSTTYPALQRS